MRSRGTGTLPARLKAGRRRFECWRRTRKGRSRIPDPLWNLAVKLSATYGTHRTAKTLRLSPDSLKKHVASANGNGSRRQAKSLRIARARRSVGAPYNPSQAAVVAVRRGHDRAGPTVVFLSSLSLWAPHSLRGRRCRGQSTP